MKTTVRIHFTIQNDWFCNNWTIKKEKKNYSSEFKPKFWENYQKFKGKYIKENVRSMVIEGWGVCVFGFDDRIGEKLIGFNGSG